MAEAVLEPGLVLAGKYRLGERLGVGGMGAVYRAEHLILKAPVAIKVIDRDVGVDEPTISRFMREAQAAAALRSPHVVQILDYGADDERSFMVMELLEGETLAGRIKRKRRLDPSETAWILTHVCRAVGKAHEAGIVHRDLKPDNVFLCSNEDAEIAKVLDFGVAKFEATALGGGTHTRTGSLLGTPYYMSPEQAQGNKEVDFRSDLWALGVIAFECLTGKRPFSSDGLGDLVLQICIRDIPVPSQVASVPIGFDGWFQKAVTRSPEGRFASAKELAERLREALGVELRDAAPSVPDVAVSVGPGSLASDSFRPPASQHATAPLRAVPSSSADSEVTLDGFGTTPRPSGDGDGRAVDARAITVLEEPGPPASGNAAPVSSDPLHESASRSVDGASDVLGATQFGSSQISTVIPKRSAWPVVLVGAGALVAGIFAAVVTFGDRPGFRVGDVEGPNERAAASSATRVNQGSRASANEATEESDSGARSRPSTSRSGWSAADKRIAADLEEAFSPDAEKAAASEGESGEVDPEGASSSEAATGADETETTASSTEGTGGEPATSTSPAASSAPPTAAPSTTPKANPPAEEPADEKETKDPEPAPVVPQEVVPKSPPAPPPKNDATPRSLPAQDATPQADPKSGESSEAPPTEGTRPATEGTDSKSGSSAPVWPDVPDSDVPDEDRSFEEPRHTQPGEPLLPV